MSASEISLKNGSAAWYSTQEGYNVTPGAVISIQLVSAVGVSQWTLQVFGVDEVTGNPPVLVGVDSTTNVVSTPTSIVTFTMPAGVGVGRAILFRSMTNGGEDVSTFGVYTFTSGGLRVAAVGERFEGNSNFGWAPTLNSLIRSGGGGGGGGAGLPPLIGVQYAALMEDPIGGLKFQKLTTSMITGGGPQGPVGPQGPTGATGATGPAGGGSGSASFLVGEIKAWTGATPPTKWVLCDGRDLSRTVYSELNALYASQGYPFGPGDGTATFSIPDARGRTLIGSGIVTPPLSTNRAIGDKFGEEDTILTAGQSGLSGHSHDLTGTLHNHYVDGPHNHPMTTYHSHGFQLVDLQQEFSVPHSHSLLADPHQHPVGLLVSNSTASGYTVVSGTNNIGSTTLLTSYTGNTTVTGYTDTIYVSGYTAYSSPSGYTSNDSAGDYTDTAYVSTYTSDSTTGYSTDTTIDSDALIPHTNMQPSLVINYILYVGV